MENAELIEVKSINELENLFESNTESPVLIFKHSITCSISRSVFSDVRQFEGPVHMIVVQHSRDVSQAVAEKTGVRHESPQALIIKDGKCVYNASHYDITPSELKKYF